MAEGGTTTKKTEGSDDPVKPIDSLIRTIRDPAYREEFVSKAILFQIASPAIILPLVCLTMTVQVVGAGWHVARMLYGKDWIIWFIIAFTVPAGLFLFSLLLDLVFFRLFAAMLWPFGWLLRRLFGNRRVKALSNAGPYIFIGIMGLAILSLALTASYMQARDKAKMPTTPSPKAAQEIQAVVTSQQKASEKVSESATALLKDLDETGTQLEETKARLRATLAQAEHQRDQAARNAAEIESLMGQEQLVEVRNAKLRELLDGERPITVTYFDRSGYEQMILGALLGWVLGIVTSNFSKVLGWVRGRIPKPR